MSIADDHSFVKYSKFMRSFLVQISLGIVYIFSCDGTQDLFSEIKFIIYNEIY